MFEKKCGEKCEVWSRIVGYYRPIKDWNPGKKEEFRIRKTANLTKWGLEEVGENEDLIEGDSEE